MLVRLAGQPSQVLLLLLAKRGDLITREDLATSFGVMEPLWILKHGLNAADHKLRRALGDSAEHPRYIETITGRGYRFIGTIERKP